MPWNPVSAISRSRPPGHVVNVTFGAALDPSRLHAQPRDGRVGSGAVAGVGDRLRDRGAVRLVHVLHDDRVVDDRRGALRRLGERVAEPRRRFLLDRSWPAWTGRSRSPRRGCEGARSGRATRTSAASGDLRRRSRRSGSDRIRRVRRRRRHSTAPRSRAAASLTNAPRAGRATRRFPSSRRRPRSGTGPSAC